MIYGIRISPCKQRNGDSGKGVKMTRAEILKTAEKCVNGDRQRDYGTPEDNFRLIARLWSVTLGRTVTPIEVSVMMMQLKAARILTGRATADSFVDIAGYAACGGEIATGGKQEARGMVALNSDHPDFAPRADLRGSDSGKGV